MSNLSKEPYKGVRDFYPEDMYIQKYLFETMRRVVEKYGYVEYNASVLEPADLYRAKSGEEIINEQTYSFIDRGDREVTLRPEMTPTITRMIAARRRELALPIRWYSIPNLFRYERPQRGRLREHWQLNVDLFGSTSIHAEVEMLSIAHDILTTFGLSSENFIIKINTRELIDAIFKEYLTLPPDKSYTLSKIIDKKNKIDPKEFNEQLTILLEDKSEVMLHILDASDIPSLEAVLPPLLKEHASLEKLKTLLKELKVLEINNVSFDGSLIRGFDYYTGIIFEVFDTHPTNNRSIFGGGRFDKLLEIFDEESIPAVGFGMGDVILRDILETYNLLPEYTPTIDLYLCILDEKHVSYAQKLAQDLRRENIRVAIDITERKVGNQITAANKLGIPYTIVIGEDEARTGMYTLKKLQTGEEKKVSREELPQTLKA